MSQSEIEQIEMTITEARKVADRGRLAQKLSLQPAFRKLVLEGYFVEEASRLALLSSDPTLPEHIRDAVKRDLNGPGAFKRYLSTIVQMGQMAEQEIRESEETLEEIREEEFEADEDDGSED